MSRGSASVPISVKNDKSLYSNLGAERCLSRIYTFTTNTLAAIVVAGCLGAPDRVLAGETIPYFNNPVVFDVGPNPYGLAIGDIGAENDQCPDGFPDIAVANGNMDVPNFGFPGGDGTVTIFLNTGDWTPTSDGLVLSQTVFICVDCVPAEVEFADMDNDLDLDLVVSAAEGSTGHGIYVAMNNGTGVFGTAVRYATQLPVRGLVVADFDGDGYNDAAGGVDLWQTGANVDRVLILFNDGTGALNDQEVVISLGLGNDQPPCDLVAADFNKLTIGPTRIDIVTANMWHESVSVITNLGNRSFSVNTIEPAQGCANPDWRFESITTNRFKAGSQHEDIATTEFLDDVVDILHGTLGGGFTYDCSQDLSDRYRVNPNNAALCWGIDSGHLNGGVKPDVAVALYNANEVSIILGKGDGTFQSPPDDGYHFNMDPSGPDDADGSIMVKIADLDQDGFGDLVTSNHYSDNISVRINKMVVAGGGG